MIDKSDFMRRVKTYFHETMIFAYYLLIFQMPNIMHEIDIVAPVNFCDLQEIYNLFALTLLFNRLDLIIK